MNEAFKIQTIRKNSFPFILRSVFILLSGLCTLLFAIFILHACFAAFTWGKFVLSDFGKYTNMIWNCGHGRFYYYLVDHSYFGTHLSFTLALIGPLFWIWDHPFLLSIAQWLQLLGGTLILWRTAYLKNVGSEFISALLFFYVANSFTQSVMLSEYHGVSLYFLLLPWLYHTLSGSKKMAWIPFILLLGVREESGILITPLILYFALKNRWRCGFLMAVIAPFYSILAIKVLFPVLSGITYNERRGISSSLHDYTHLLSLPQFLLRGKPLVWYSLIASFFLRRRGWIPILVFPFVAIFATVTSGYPWIFLQQGHYPANHLVLFTLGILEARTLFLKKEAKARVFEGLICALFLAGMTWIWHWQTGYLYLGKNSNRIYSTIHPRGFEILEAVQHIPKEGLLLCDQELAGFCANRRDIMTWEYLGEKAYQPDLVFTRQKYLKNHLEFYKPKIQDGSFGVSYCEHGYVIFQKGYTTLRNEEVFKGVFEK